MWLNKFFSKLGRGGSIVPAYFILFIVVAYPLATIVLQSVFPDMFNFTPSFKPSLSVVQSVFTDKYTYHAILDSFLIGLCASLISCVIGTALAIIMKRQESRWLGKTVDVIVWLIFFTPSYILSEGWMTFISRNGLLDQMIHLPSSVQSAFFSPVTLVIIMAFKYFPFVYISVGSALDHLGSEYEDAARLLGAKSWKAWLRVNIPLLRPAILAGAAITFAEGIGDFGFAATIAQDSHLNLISYAIYTALSQAPVDYPKAGILAFVLIMIIAAAMIFQTRLLKRGTYSIIQNQIRPTRKLSLGRHVFWVYPVTVLVLVLAYAVPMFSTLIASFLKVLGNGFQLSNLTFDHYITALNTSGAAWQAISYSLELSLGVAVLVVILGLWMAYLIEHSTLPGTKFLFYLTMSTIAIPGIVLAAGFVFAFNATWLVPLHLAIYGTTACLFLAYLATALPYSIRLHIGALAQISPALITAGRLQGASMGVIFRKIIFPLVAATTISTFFLSFTSVLFELPASNLLYPAGSPPFPILIMKEYADFKWGTGAALTIIGIVGAMILFGIGRLIMNKRFSASFYSDPVDAGTDLEDRNYTPESMSNPKDEVI